MPLQPPPEAIDQLVGAMVNATPWTEGDPAPEALYDAVAEYHAGVQQLARMLVLWLGAMAADAWRTAQARQHQAELDARFPRDNRVQGLPDGG